MTDEAARADSGAESAVAGVGEELARARQARGFTVADIAQQLKFAPRQIAALEAGRFQDLPAGTFARGMVRSYARLLKLDPELLVGRMAARVVVPDNADAVASVQRPIPITDSARHTNLIYGTLSVLFLGVIAAVAFEWQREKNGTARMTFVEAAKPQAGAQPAIDPQRAALASTAAPAIAEAPAAEPQAAAAPVAEALVPVAAGKRRILMRFEQESWVEIRNRDGKILTSELNPSGSERAVDGIPPFAVIIGNAHHVKLSYDERPINLAPFVKVEVARFTLE